MAGVRAEFREFMKAEAAKMERQRRGKKQQDDISSRSNYSSSDSSSGSEPDSRESDEERYCQCKDHFCLLERRIQREVKRELRQLQRARRNRCDDSADDGVGRGGRRRAGGADAQYRSNSTSRPRRGSLAPGIATVRLTTEFRVRGEVRGLLPMGKPTASFKYLPVQPGDERAMATLCRHGDYYNFVHENHDPDLVRGDRQITRRITFSADTRPPLTGVEVPFPGGVWRIERFIWSEPQNDDGTGCRGFEKLYLLEEP
ncbi:hypothetical protein TWF481_006366 [Arthrobotrys musiformis]|uniref:Uncharacterized protein n=1 Tax=Arthrobotrys musiformis TaxID=47236 RepID=A0AAV9WIG7_9PEZI